MSEAQELPRRPKNLVRHFLIVNFFYLLVVHVWFIGAHPVGVDYARLAAPDSYLAAGVIGIEKAVFGGFAPGYHVLNIALLYGCMVATFFLTRYTVGGQVWMGSLAATMLMANPLKSEAVLHATGAVDLLPAFLALAALALYTSKSDGRILRRTVQAAACFALAAFLSEHYIPLIVPLILLEILFGERGNRRLLRVVPFLAITIAATAFHVWIGQVRWPGFGQAFGPLCLIWYPIGLLPGTAGFYRELPVAGWLVAAITTAFFALIAWKARQRAIVFGLIAMAAMRLVSAGEEFDFVHMRGGGGMILPIAFFNIAFASLCRRIMWHPKWPQPVVYLTAAVCVLLFVLQIQVIGDWRRAGREVAAFQGDAAAWAAEHPGEPLGILPDWRFHGRAPVALSESVSWDTPFSRVVPHVAVLTVEDKAAFEKDIRIESWEPGGGTLHFEGQDVAAALGQIRPDASIRMRIEPLGAREFRLYVEPRDGTLPETLLPAESGGGGQR